jgi:hypothetical protein
VEKVYGNIFVNGGYVISKIFYKNVASYLRILLHVKIFSTKLAVCFEKDRLGFKVYFGLLTIDMDKNKICRQKSGLTTQKFGCFGNATIVWRKHTKLSDDKSTIRFME